VPSSQIFMLIDQKISAGRHAVSLIEAMPRFTLFYREYDTSTNNRALAIIEAQDFAQKNDISICAAFNPQEWIDYTQNPHPVSGERHQ